MKLFIYLTVALALASGAKGLSNPEISTKESVSNICMDRTGMVLSDFEQAKSRNNDCVMDCITRHGSVMSFNQNDGQACIGESKDYVCVLGSCRSPDDEPLDIEDLYSVQLNILSAIVDDMDPYPGQGESDTMVEVSVISDAGPAYKDGDMLGFTHVVQDDWNPHWNVVLKPMPLARLSKLRFTLIDSDKPGLTPDILGYGFETLDNLMNKGTTKIRVLPAGDRKPSERGQLLEVEVKAVPYRREVASYMSKRPL